MSKKFYLTTTLPYVNSTPHIGFALEIVHADIIARYKKLMGYEVFFNTGTDEHGQKIYEMAVAQDKEPQAYTDEYAAKFRELKDILGLDGEILHFIRTTDPHHKHAAQEFWRRCNANGDIYKKLYSVKYCVGCELEKTDSELVEGRCPLHPNKDLEIREEENYFFRFSRYQDRLSALYTERPDFVIPDFRFNEIKTFVEGGLKDFSISRLASKMPWGIPVPGDDTHVMYVWFDALINYISTLGWPEKADFDGLWPGTQIAGVDNLRQQSAMWQAMLMSADLPLSRQIIIHGFVISGGQKMSKSLGNVIDPLTIVNEYGSEALRYYLARHVHPFLDTDVTMERIHEAYNANLANGLGNLVARIMKLAETHLEVSPEIPENTIPDTFKVALDRFVINEATDIVWRHIGELDQRIQAEQPFKVVKDDTEKGKDMIRSLVIDLYTIARMLNPLMPETSKDIKKAIKENKMPASLFARKE